MKLDLKQALSNTVHELCEPTRAALVPRPFRHPLSPGFYPDAVDIQTPDAAEAFKGVIIVKPDLNEFIQFSFNDVATESVTDGQAVVYGQGDHGVRNPGTGFYTTKFTMQSGNTPIQEAQLRKLPVSTTGFYARTDDNRWISGYVWTVEGYIGTSASAKVDNIQCSPDGAGVEVPADTVLWRAGRFNDTYTSVSYQQSVTMVTGTQSYDLPDFPTITTSQPLVFGFQLLSPLIGEFKFDYVLQHINYTLNTQQIVTLPIKADNDPIFAGILQQATQYSIPRFSCQFEYTGSTQYNAGNVSCALVPYGTVVNMQDPVGTMAMIDALPYHNYKGRASKGCHVVYYPAKTQDIFLRPLNEKINGNFIVIAWNCPAASVSGQGPSFKLHWKPGVDWMADTSSLVQELPPWDRDLLDAIISFLAEINPCSENPSHFAKLEHMAKTIASNPIVQKAGSAVWEGIKVGSKVAIPMLMSLV